MKFEVKPRFVNAEQYVPGRSLPPGVKLGNIGRGSPEAYILTKFGCVSVNQGDWVVENVDGTYEVEADEIFQRKYKAVA